MIDGEQICINLGMLAEVSNLMTGDPFLCEVCGCALSVFSQVRKRPDDVPHSYMWPCDFCSNVLTLSLDDAEFPKSEMTDCISLRAETDLSELNQGSEKDEGMIWCGGGNKREGVLLQ